MTRIDIYISNTKLRSKFSTLASHFDKTLNELVEYLLTKMYVKVYGDIEVGDAIYTEDFFDLTPLQSSVIQTVEKTAIKQPKQVSFEPVDFDSDDDE